MDLMILKNLGSSFVFKKFGVEGLTIFCFLKIWGVGVARSYFLKNLGCRSCGGQTNLTNFSQTFPKYYPPENFFGTSRRGAKKF